jgi:hypothetical protein
MANSDGALAESGMAIAVISRTGECNELVVSSNHLSVCCVDGGRKGRKRDERATRPKGLRWWEGMAVDCRMSLFVNLVSCF